MKLNHLYILALASTLIISSCANEEFEDPVSIDVPSQDFVAKDIVKVYFAEGNVAVDLPLGRTDVTYVVNNGYVTITNTNETDELMFILSGSSTNGGLVYNGIYKCTFVLDNLSLVSKIGPALDIQCGKRVNIKMTEGSENSLEDAAGGIHKGCLYCRGHVKITGNGNLTVKGNTKNGIHIKEYLKIGSSVGKITVKEVVGHAISVGEDFEMEGGTLDLAATNMDSRAIECDSTVTISGGNIDILASGNGSRGIQANYDITINENSGPTVINIAANGGKCSEPDEHRCMGMKTDLVFKMSAGYVTVTKLLSNARGIRCLSKEITGGTCDAEIKEGL